MKVKTGFGTVSWNEDRNDSRRLVKHHQRRAWPLPSTARTADSLSMITTKAPAAVPKQRCRWVDRAATGGVSLTIKGRLAMFYRDGLLKVLALRGIVEKLA
jgi:hypothetical protein